MKASELGPQQVGMTLVRDKKLHHITAVHANASSVMIRNKYRPHLRLVLNPNEDIEVEP
ncbi:hypothetical protein [Rhodococcus sp. RS1C4]|nr:hypothetical protein [Rhodococcus sp. RS1C4]